MKTYFKKGLGHFQDKPVCKWQFKSAEAASRHHTEGRGTELRETGCGNKSGGGGACGSFDKQMASHVPESLLRGERSRLQPGKEGRRVAGFGLMFGGYQLFGVHPSTWLSVPASGEGCEGGGVRVVLVKNTRHHPQMVMIAFVRAVAVTEFLRMQGQGCK